MLKEGQVVPVVCQESLMTPQKREALQYYGLYARGYEYRQRHPDAFPNSPYLFDITRLNRSNLLSEPPLQPVGESQIDNIIHRVSQPVPRDKAGRSQHYSAIAEAIRAVNADEVGIDEASCETFFNHLSSLDRLTGGLAYIRAYALGMSEVNVRIQDRHRGIFEEPNPADIANGAAEVFRMTPADQAIVKSFLRLSTQMGVDPYPANDVGALWEYFNTDHIRALMPVIDPVIQYLDSTQLPLNMVFHAVYQSKMQKYFNVADVSGPSVSDFLFRTATPESNFKSMLALRLLGTNIDSSTFQSFVPMVLWLQKKAPNGDIY